MYMCKEVNIESCSSNVGWGMCIFLFIMVENKKIEI